MSIIKIPLALGPKILDVVMVKITADELEVASQSWKQTHHNIITYMKSSVKQVKCQKKVEHQKLLKEPYFSFRHAE